MISRGPISNAQNLRPADLAKYIDHTCLRPEASPQRMEKLCVEAKSSSFFSVCVNPIYVGLCREKLNGSGVKVCSVVGFPLGATPLEVKAFETAQAVENGAAEIDMVISIGHLKSGNYKYVQRDIEAVVKAAGASGVKVILECALLTDQEKVLGGKIAKDSGASFVKTSTGFFGGASADDVSILRRTVGADIGVKASGGITTFQESIQMLKAGANRIGASASMTIISEMKINGN